MNDTICAIASPPGVGAMAIIRVSGEKAISLCDTLFLPKDSKKRLSDQPSHTVIFGQFQQEGYLIDEVVATLFRNPHSFTGENTVEFTCHGSTYIQQKMIRVLMETGCRLAEPGEFSRRAFQNGKLDLAQAEAVADLIASSSAANHKLAMRQMRGGISREMDKLRGQLLHFVSLIELELDFGEEEVEFANRTELTELAAKLEKNLRKLTESFRLGNALKNGIPVAIVGETNAGKSTLLNQLLNEDKAIVSPIPGTTRDVIEDRVNIRGISFRFIDTAGLRQTKDEIELIGIERAYQQIEQANIVLWVIDATQFTEHIEWMASRILPRSEGKVLMVLFNKMDKLEKEELRVLDEQFKSISPHRLFISAKKGLHLDALNAKLLELAGLPDLARQDVIVTNLRHYQALKAAHEAILRVQEGLNLEQSSEFLSQDLRECIHHLGEITGVITTDEVLGNIFAHFCIGK